MPLFRRSTFPRQHADIVVWATPCAIAAADWDSYTSPVSTHLTGLAFLGAPPANAFLLDSLVPQNGQYETSLLHSLPSRNLILQPSPESAIESPFGMLEHV